MAENPSKSRRLHHIFKFMKKNLLFAAALLVGMTLASCGNGKAIDTVENDSIAVDTVVVVMVQKPQHQQPNQQKQLQLKPHQRQRKCPMVKTRILMVVMW